jgi:hypothetical protein
MSHENAARRIYNMLTGDQSDFAQSYRLTPQTCSVCGVRFAIDSEYFKQLRDGHGGCESPDDDAIERPDSPDATAGSAWFSCPNGHKQQFTHRTAEVLGEQMMQLASRLDQAEAKIGELTSALRRAERDRDRFSGQLASGGETRVSGGTRRKARGARGVAADERSD